MSQLALSAPALFYQSFTLPPRLHRGGEFLSDQFLSSPAKHKTAKPGLNHAKREKAFLHRDLEKCRVSRPVPQDQWQTAEIPELRIMSDELFEEVQKQLNGRRHVNRRENIGVHKRPKRLLSGLLKCGACGSGMSVAGVDKSGRTRLRCSAHTNSGSCPDPKTYYLDEVEALVIESLTKELATADQIKRYAEVYQKERRKQARQENRRRIEIEARLKAIEKENMRLVNLMLLDDADTQTLGAKTKENGAERDQLQLELASLPEGTTVTVHPAAIENFARKLSMARAKLEMTLSMLEDMGELSSLIREIIESITLSKEGKTIVIEARSWLDPFLSDEGKPRIIKGAGPLVAEEGPATNSAESLTNPEVSRPQHRSRIRIPVTNLSDAQRLMLSPFRTPTANFRRQESVSNLMLSERCVEQGA